jgi:hypothetical protein
MEGGITPLGLFLYGDMLDKPQKNNYFPEEPEPPEPYMLSKVLTT